MSRTIRRKNAHDKHWYTDSWFYGYPDNRDRPDDDPLDKYERARFGVLTVGPAKARRRAWYHSDNARLRTSAPGKFCRRFNRRLRHIHRHQVRDAIVNERCDALSLRPFIASEGSWYYF